MYRKELFVLSAVTLFIFTMVAIVSLIMERALQYDAQMLAVDTFPGLVNSGDALNRVNENWHNIYLLPGLPDAATRSNSIARIMSNSTTNFWREYQKSIFDLRDHLLFVQMQNSRSNYFTLVTNYFDLIGRQKLAEARQLLDTRLQPAYLDYKSNAFALFQLNTDIGQQRVRHISELSGWLPWLVGFFCAVIFFFGVVVGLKGAFGSLAFARRLRERPKDESHRKVLTNWQ